MIRSLLLIWFSPLVAVILVSAAALTIIFWLFWLIWKLHRFIRKPRPTKTPMPQIDASLAGVSRIKLLGAGAEGKVDAVFEGGGVKAIAQLGAAHSIKRLELEWGVLGGASGGAIVASLLAAEKSLEEIWDILSGDQLSSLVTVWYLPQIPFLQRRIYYYVPLLPNLMFNKGFVSGDRFLQIMRENLRLEGRALRFGDLLNQGVEKPRHRLKVLATDISRGVPIFLPDDLPCYWEAWDNAASLSGKDPSQLTRQDVQDWWPVADAVRMSMSYPFFFKPYTLHLNYSREGEALETQAMGVKGPRVSILDGGVSSNFPIWLFDRTGRQPRWPTFGFLLDEQKGRGRPSVRRVNDLIDLAAGVVLTGIGAMDKRLSDHDNYRTARLRTQGVKTTEFGLSRERQEKLLKSGGVDAIEFLERFDWAEYKKRFRRPD
ncbi:MAG: patatin-like phospholipase family protein [Dehalococcoidia bacterium]